MSNYELQQMECEAMTSIVGESNFHFNESTRSGWLKVEVNVPPDGVRARSGVNKVATFNNLPPFTLNFALPKDYPSESAPEISELNCKWLSTEQVSGLMAMKKFKV